MQRKVREETDSTHIKCVWGDSILFSHTAHVSSLTVQDPYMYPAFFPTSFFPSGFELGMYCGSGRSSGLLQQDAHLLWILDFLWVLLL